MGQGSGRREVLIRSASEDNDIGTLPLAELVQSFGGSGFALGNDSPTPKDGGGAPTT
jgi:hypothetical protein